MDDTLHARILVLERKVAELMHPLLRMLPVERAIIDVGMTTGRTTIEGAAICYNGMPVITARISASDRFFLARYIGNTRVTWRVCEVVGSPTEYQLIPQMEELNARSARDQS